ALADPFFVGDAFGNVRLFVPDGSVTQTFAGNGSIANLGPEVLIGAAPANSPQIARLFSVGDGSLLATFSEQGLITSPGFFEPGVAVASVGDANGDGVPELVMGGLPSAYL